MAGQRQLQTAAKTRAVDRRDHRDRQSVDLSHDLLSLTSEFFGLHRTVSAGDHINICPRDKIIWFG
ncbi:hypothetical protein D3C85_1848950 [compost metagenome]